jgi:hypothetical protein
LIIVRRRTWRETCCRIVWVEQMMGSIIEGHDNEEYRAAGKIMIRRRGKV